MTAMLALTAPAAFAWPSCDEASLQPPIALHREAPAYPATVRDSGIEGSVEVALTILRDGGVGWVKVLHADPPGYFEQAAVDGVRRWRFEPARQDGRPVECRLLTRVRFTLVDTVDTSSQPLATDRPDPAYPARLLVERVEGYAEVQFELAADGSVLQPRIITAMPRGEFEVAALEAIRSWRFPPDSTARRMQRRFDFRLPDSTLHDLPPIMLASAPFPMEACKRRQAGQVSLEVATDADGSVRQARILTSDPKGVFDRSALVIAKASRMTPSYRDGQPQAALALLTLFFDPDKASCPGSLVPDPQRPAKGRPPAAVSGHDERPAGRAERLVVHGTSIYPDATFTLRLSYGAMMGWNEKGEDVRPWTELGRAFERATGEIVGLAFDGNIHSISGSYWFDDRLNRSIGVHPAYIRLALEKVYGAKELLDEIDRR